MTTEVMGASQDITRLTSNDDVDPGFLCRQLLREATSLRRKSRGTTIQGVTKNELHALSLLLPPLPEQRAIANILDSIDHAIEATDALVSANEQLRDSLLHNLLTRGLPGHHTEWKEVPGLGTIPTDWEVTPLGEFADVKGGVGFPLNRQGRRQGEFPFIKVSDMTLEGNESYIRRANNYVDLNDIEELGANIFQYGSIVFPKVGAAIATNKKRVLSIPTIIDNNMVGITVTEGQRCDYRYLYAWFESIDLSEFANVSTVPSITGSRLKKILIPLPSLPEQKNIAAILDSSDELIENGRGAGEGLRKLKESASNALLTGRVRVLRRGS